MVTLWIIVMFMNNNKHNFVVFVDNLDVFKPSHFKTQGLTCLKFKLNIQSTLELIVIKISTHVINKISKFQQNKK